MEDLDDLKQKQSTSNLQALDTAMRSEKESKEEVQFLDFDAKYREYKKTSSPIKIKIQGKVIEIPSSMPASFALFMSSHTTIDEKGKSVYKVAPSDYGQLVESAFGTSVLKRIFDMGMEMEFVFQEMIPMLYSAWGEPNAKNDKTTPQK